MPADESMYTYLIRGVAERDPLSPDEPLYWSNGDGWVPLAYADLYTLDERNTLNLPIGGEWTLDV